MSGKTSPQAANPYVNLSFEELKTRFDNPALCQTDAYTVATYMFNADSTKAQRLLPLKSDGEGKAHSFGMSLDFNKSGDVTTKEWASAMVAARELKRTAGELLGGKEATQFIDRACTIYGKQSGGVSQCTRS